MAYRSYVFLPNNSSTMPPNSYEITEAPIERLNTTHTLWCSAASPRSDAKFAIGTSNGLYMLNNAFNAHWGYYQALTPNALRGRPGKTDVTAVGFYQDTLVAAGMRNSTILLYDERSSSHAMDLQHTERVDKIYHVHGHLLMAAGPTSVSRTSDARFVNSLTLILEVRIYDVRAASNVVQKSAKLRSPFRQCSQPYLTFPDCTPGVNNVMDVSAKNNLIACGMYIFLHTYFNTRSFIPMSRSSMSSCVT